MASVWASAGNVSRSASELGTVRVEQQRMLRSNNQITATRTQEADARSEEAETDQQKFVDKIAKQSSLEMAKTAAELTKWASCISLVGTIVAGAGSGSLGANAGDIIGGLFDVMSKFMEANKLDGELDIVSEQVGRLKKAKNQSDKAVAALDANPAV